MRGKLIKVSLVAIALILLVSDPLVAEKSKEADAPIESSYPVSKVISEIKSVELDDPSWLLEERQAAGTTPARRSGPKIAVTYSVITRGPVTANLAEFKMQANETLNSPSGWSRLGMSFSEVNSGGDFILVLSTAAQVPSFSPAGCSADWSCNVGNYVIINQDRWLGASSAWNAAGGTLRDYRHMVVNHETGHWLGHGHTYCSGAGNAANVMQQQSIDLQGCRFNPWPLSSELSAPRFGI